MHYYFHQRSPCRRSIDEVMAAIFNAPGLIKCLFFAFIGALLFYLGVGRKARKPEKIFSNETIFFLGSWLPLHP